MKIATFLLAICAILTAPNAAFAHGGHGGCGQLQMTAAAARVPALPDVAPCNAFVPWGMPTTSRTVTVVCRTAYMTAVDNERLVPAWVTWPLTADHAMGCLARKNQFAGDPDIAGRRALPKDYDGTHMDRGHSADADDMLWDKDVRRQSFFMSNMSPQVPGLNEQEWEQLEAYSRAWAVQGYGPLNITVVPIWDTAPATIGDDHVGVPRAFAKVIVSPSTGQALAFEMNNVPIAKGPVFPFAVSIAQVEQDSGVKIPMPATIDRIHVKPPWPGDLSAYAKAKAAHCEASK